jgi:hypothetical protein
MIEAIGGLSGWLIVGLIFAFLLWIMFFDKFFPTGF